MNFTLNQQQDLLTLHLMGSMRSYTKKLRVAILSYPQYELKVLSNDDINFVEEDHLIEFRYDLLPNHETILLLDPTLNIVMASMSSSSSFVPFSMSMNVVNVRYDNRLHCLVTLTYIHTHMGAFCEILQATHSQQTQQPIGNLLLPLLLNLLFSMKIMHLSPTSFNLTTAISGSTATPITPERLGPTFHFSPVVVESQNVNPPFSIHFVKDQYVVEMDNAPECVVISMTSFLGVNIGFSMTLNKFDSLFVRGADGRVVMFLPSWIKHAQIVQTMFEFLSEIQQE